MFLKLRSNSKQRLLRVLCTSLCWTLAFILAVGSLLRELLDHADSAHFERIATNHLWWIYELKNILCVSRGGRSFSASTDSSE